jgi:hypothetical protein
MLRIGKRREEYFAVAQAALLEAKHRKSIGNPGKSGYLLGQRGNERFVGKPEAIAHSRPADSRVHVEAILVRDQSTKFIAVVRRN